jgi:hypothetical protein
MSRVTRCLGKGVSGRGDPSAVKSLAAACRVRLPSGASRAASVRIGPMPCRYGGQPAEQAVQRGGHEFGNMLPYFWRRVLPEPIG